MVDRAVNEFRLLKSTETRFETDAQGANKYEIDWAVVRSILGYDQASKPAAGAATESQGAATESQGAATESQPTTLQVTLQEPFKKTTTTSTPRTTREDYTGTAWKLLLLLWILVMFL